MSDDVLGRHFDPKFYLVLKGEIAIFHAPDEKYLSLLAADVPGHVYTAGPWLSPFHVPKGHRLELNNVTGGDDTPEDHSDFLVRLPGAKPAPDLARFVIKVPLPQAILPGAIQDASNVVITVLTDQGPMTLRPKYTCVSAILVYGWDGKNEPDLSDSYSGVHWPCGGKLRPFRSLHVTTSGERDEEEEDPGHAREAFRRAAEVLGVSADINFLDIGRVHGTTPPHGLSFLETNATYFETLQLGRALGELLQGGKSQIPDVPLQPVKLQDGNCGPIVG
jgi:hypothetical protein